MKARLLLAACLAFRLSQASAEPDNLPYASMRTLQILQEQIAHGNATAQAAQPQLMAHIADGFLAADPAVWRDLRNVRAAILFLLSGGRPAVIRTVLKTAEFPASVDRLLKGSLAYAEGQDRVARALLDPVDPQTLPTGLGSHLALVKAGLVVDEDAAKAVKLLDLARLLAPGTLIEESAIRREVFLLLDTAATDKAMLLARQYIRRFRGSTYAMNFRQRFATAALSMAVAGDTARLTKLDTVLSDMTPEEARTFYLKLARSSILAGKTDATRLAADKALALAGSNPTAVAQGKLYRGAALMVSDDASEGLSLLKDMNESLLSPEEKSLREAALAIGAAIQADGPNASGTDPGAGSSDPTAATIDRARVALTESDRLLELPSQ